MNKLLIQTLDGYRVTRSHGCVVIFGLVPLNDVQVLARLAPRDALMSADMASRLGASLVFGTRKQLDELQASIEDKPVPFAIAGLSDQAVAWLASGRRGISSETIFTLVTGTPCINVEDMSPPGDTGDFKRCQRLLEQCPEIAAKFVEVMRNEEGWGNLVQNWDEILKRLDAEAPNWRSGEYSESTFNTGLYMQQLLS